MILNCVTIIHCWLLPDSSSILSRYGCSETLLPKQRITCQVVYPRKVWIWRPHGLLSSKRNHSIPRLLDVRCSVVLRLQRPGRLVLRLPRTLHPLLLPTSYLIVTLSGHHLALSSVRDAASDVRTSTLSSSQISLGSAAETRFQMANKSFFWLPGVWTGQWTAAWLPGVRN